jgi:peptide/nickel transport system permease protein
VRGVVLKRLTRWRGMGTYVAGRLAAGIGTVLVVSVVVFVALHMVPGSYADILTGQTASPQVRAKVVAEYGLGQPLPVQYVKWLGHAVTGDLGASLGTGESVTDQLARRLPVTAELTLLALALTLIVGLPLALLAGMARTRTSRESSRFLGATAMSMPDFVLGSILVYLFSRYALGLRVGGYVPFVDDPAGNLRAMLLPALTLSVFGIAILVRTGRDAVASVLSSPHITAATARGESTAHIVRHHVLRNAAIPVVTVLAIYTGYLMGGAVIVENLFSLPGIGQSVLNGVTNRDYPIVQGTVLLAATAFIAINMLADFAYGAFDPRVVAGVRS